MDHRSYLDPANQAVTNSHKRKMESTPTWGYSAAPTTTPTTTTPTTATAHPSAKKRPRTSANPPASHSNTTPSLPLGGETLVGSEAQKNGGTEEEIDLERWDLPAILNLPSVEDFEKSNTLPEISSLRTLSNCPERARELIQQRALETKVESIARQHNLRLEGKVILLIHDALLCSLRDIMDGLVALAIHRRRSVGRSATNPFNIEDLTYCVKKSPYLRQKTRDFLLKRLTSDAMNMNVEM